MEQLVYKLGTYTNNVAGKVIVSGGGVDSIHVEKTTVEKGARVKVSHPVKLVSEGNKLAAQAGKCQTIVRTGTFSEVVVPAGTVLDLKSTTVDKITVQANGSDTVEAGGKVSYDVAHAIDKAKEIQAYLEANKNDKDLQKAAQKVKNFLEQFDVIIDKNNLSVKGKVTVKAGTLGETEYTVTIKY